MIPGMATIPVASSTVTPSGAAMLVPTSAILPSRIRIDPLGIVPRVTVRIVASLIRTVAAGPDRRLAVGVELGGDVDERGAFGLVVLAPWGCWWGRPWSARPAATLGSSFGATAVLAITFFGLGP